jgi:hypothetical protein
MRLNMKNFLGVVVESTILFSLLPSTFAQTCWRNTTCTGPLDTPFPGIWESNIFSPSSRTVSPKSILSVTTGDIISSFPGNSLLVGNGSQLVFDFGTEVGGIVSLEYTSTGAGAIGLAFTEAKTYIGEWSDSSNEQVLPPDGAIYANFTSAVEGTYVMPDAKLRGGFRYLTLFLITNGTNSVNITDISLEIGFQPTWSNLKAYQGYFHSSDELLNRIWYSGAYTLQTDLVPVNTGRWVPWSGPGWANNGTLGPGDTTIVDGAKRDRAVWPGDMGIAVPSLFVSLGDLESVKNALQVMYNTQNPTTGAFDESGPPLSQMGSDTYHMWSMIGTYNYVLYTNDTDFLALNWVAYQKAMVFIYDKVDSTGLLNVTGIRDWARLVQGFNNTEAQMILYRTLITGADLAVWMNDTTGLSALWTSHAAALQTVINAKCWDDQFGAFKDNATATTLHPQDANSMSVLFGVVNNSRAENISEKLLENWTPIGAVTPELPDNISPFISGFEIQAHFEIGRADRALDLIRRSWGWYINNPNGTESTVIEGYLQNASFGYRANRGYDFDTSYVSHSHGWSSAPTSALTTYILGISVTSRLGQTWKLAPQFGNLTSAEGAFITSLGTFSASWNLTAGGGFNLEFEMPVGTVGEVVLPQSNSSDTLVTVGGEKVDINFAAVKGGSRYVVRSS